jgi:4-hydroxyproline epimerase
VVAWGGPDLGGGAVAEQAGRLARDHDYFRSAVVNEPRGHDVLVGALLCRPADPACAAGVIFFNNVGLLGMCGHGTIGLVATLAHLGRIGPGRHRIETPVGIVEADLRADGNVEIRNVPSWRAARGVPVQLADGARVSGDIAWGGNWFFITENHGAALELARVHELSALATMIRRAVNASGHPEVDHVELVGPGGGGADARNFVLCPGLAYDRSPCGTGTSAKLACLAADGKLAPGERWVQESILGSRFVGRYEHGADGKSVIPFIAGSAHVTSESTLILDPGDPFLWGIRPVS